jgi:transposase
MNIESFGTQQCNDGACAREQTNKETGIATQSRLMLVQAIAELGRLREENAELRRQNILQAEEIRLMKLREHGRSSEKLCPEDVRQGSLFNEAELYSVMESQPETTEVIRVTKTVYTRRKRGRKPIDPKLSRIEVVVDLPDSEKTVGDGYELVRIGEETSEQVHEVPQKYIVIRTVRPKYVVRPANAAANEGEGEAASEIRVAPMPPRIMPRSTATPSLLASVITGKFCDGLPFYRQERMFARHGLQISRQDMANWSMAIAKKLETFEELLRNELLSSPYLHCD